MAEIRGAHSGTAYRPDIDGLRAVSVLAVILFHAKVPGFGGGFVGVDVFFVISGFLITRLFVNRPPGASPLHLGEFYVRRARRILPALLLVLVASTVAALVLYVPLDLRYFGRGLAWCSSMLGNFAAFRAGDYFNPPFASLPLQHLWSIAVEEQFYLVYPLLLVPCLAYAPRLRLPGTLGAALLSFGVCVWASRAWPVLNYYLPVTRGWELLLGAAILRAGAPAWGGPALRTALAAGSLLTIILVVVCYSAGLPYPGVYTLAPTVATAVFIASGAQPTPVHRLLAWKPIVFIGLISYSLYLWHAPLWVFARYFALHELDAFQTCAALAATFVCAVLSWALVERPLRERRWLRAQRPFLITMAATTAALVLAGVLLWRSDGLPGRVDPFVQKLVTDEHPFMPLLERCFDETAGPEVEPKMCRFGSATPGARRVLLWGDSHAWELLPTLDESARRRGIELIFAGLGGCAPLIAEPAESTYDVWGRPLAPCNDYNRAVVRKIAELRPDTIILAAYWIESRPLPRADAASIGRAMEDTLARVRPATRRVCAVLDVPTIDHPVQQVLWIARRRGISVEFMRMRREDAYAQQRQPDAALHELERRGLLVTVDPKPLICEEPRCRVIDTDGVPIYWDTNHLSVDGAARLAPLFEQCL